MANPAFGSAAAAASVAVALLPLVGHQRDPADFPLLRQRLLEPAPLAVRLAALEGLCRGLSAWPLAPLRTALAIAARDLQPRLAAAALDALARLPAARRDLLQLARAELAPPVEQRRRRRLQALPAAPLLLLAHGRSGGELPAELQELAAEVARRRGAPVALQLLTSSQAPSLPAVDPAAPPLTLVPLLLFPGNHVRSDLPALVRTLRHRNALQRLPFLGAWPSWQRALAQETAALIAASASTNTPPLLLHHPLEGALAGRYLALLAERCGGRCLAAGPGSVPSEREAPCLPLALASNRLTDCLQAHGWEPAAARPLLARDRLRQVLLAELVALP